MKYKIKIFCFILLAAAAVAADPNRFDPNSIWADWPPPIHTADPSPAVADFSVIGVDIDAITDMNDLRVEALMLTDGQLYLLDNPRSDFSMNGSPHSQRVYKRTGMIRVFSEPMPVWQTLHRGLNIVTASATGRRLEAMDYAGTGRSFGVGIKGQVYSVELIVVNFSGTEQRFKLYFSPADTNRDGKVDLSDLAKLSNDWLNTAAVSR
ncbi:MAG: hypothetical protein WC551_11265 [Patescibacteria group bacterium]